MSCECINPRDSLTRHKLELSLRSMKPDGRRSVAIASMAFLQQIERIDVTFATDPEKKQKKLYRIDLFFRHETNRIPCNQRLSLNQSTISAASKPDISVYHSFVDFEQLRNCVASLSVGLDHSNCSYCESLYGFFIFSKYQPSKLNRIWTALQPVKTCKARQVLLNKFINELILLSRSRNNSKVPNDKYFCSGMEQVPIVLERFLRPRIPTPQRLSLP